MLTLEEAKVYLKVESNVTDEDDLDNRVNLGRSGLHSQCDRETG